MLKTSRKQMKKPESYYMKGTISDIRFVIWYRKFKSRRIYRAEMMTQKWQ
jgi:hypothetical protein